MKTSICTLAILLAAVTAFANAEDVKKKAEEMAAKIAAQQKQPATNRPTRAELESRPAVLKKTGGFLDVEAAGVSVVAIDTRKKPGVAVDQFAEVYGRLSKTNVETKKRALTAAETPYKAALAELKSHNAAFAVIIANCGDAPGLSVMPEDRVAVINADKYLGGSDPLAPESRLIKELWRGFGLAGGLGYAPYKNDVLQPVYDVKSLDALVYQVMQPMNFQRMYAQMALFGVKRARHIPYRLAVMEGWAPQPTNEYQKAIWNEIRSTPKNPMKIQFDPKKGR